MSASYFFPLADAAVVSAFGQAVTYTQASGGSPFSLGVLVDTGGKFSQPLAPMAASVFVPAAYTAIPGGPQKGDLLQITPGFMGLESGSYKVQEIQPDSNETAAYLLIRWTGQ